MKDTIRMLQALLEARSGVPSNNFYSTTPSTQSSGGIMNIFCDPTPANPSQAQLQQQASPTTQSSTDALVSLFNDDEETLTDNDTENTPKVEIIDY